MPRYTCPSCHQALLSADMNVSEGVALCSGCGVLTRLAELIVEEELNEDALTRPPAGCDVRQDFEGIRVSVSHRSLGAAAGLLFMCLFWNGIVSVFVVIALSGLYQNFLGPLPSWFPAPTMNNSSSPMPLGMTLFLCLFLIPFVLIGTALCCGFLLSVWGSTVVLISQERGSVRTGVGALGWTRRFDASQVDTVTLGSTSYEVNGKTKPLIEIKTTSEVVRFGTTMSEAQRKWLCDALRLLLIVRK